MLFKWQVFRYLHTAPNGPHIFLLVSAKLIRENTYQEKQKAFLCFDTEMEIKTGIQHKRGQKFANKNGCCKKKLH